MPRWYIILSYSGVNVSHCHNLSCKRMRTKKKAILKHPESTLMILNKLCIDRLVYSHDLGSKNSNDCHSLEFPISRYRCLLSSKDAIFLSATTSLLIITIP